MPTPTKWNGIGAEKIGNRLVCMLRLCTSFQCLPSLDFLVCCYITNVQNGTTTFWKENDEKYLHVNGLLVQWKSTVYFYTKCLFPIVADKFVCLEQYLAEEKKNHFYKDSYNNPNMKTEYINPCLSTEASLYFSYTKRRIWIRFCFRYKAKFMKSKNFDSF